MGLVKQIVIKNRTYYFYNDQKIDSKLLKIYKNHIKTFVFITLDILQLEK